MKITMEHGSGGRATSELIGEIFERSYHNEILAQMEDSAVVPGCDQIAMTTDSFVVTPLEFPGGDIGRLCICGTVNDLLMRGAIPKYITCGFIIEEGADSEVLRRIAESMARTAQEANVLIVAGDTKVVEGNGGIYINTAGVGFLQEGTDISATNCQDGDVVIVSGTLGDHHAAILSSRMEIHNSIVSDNAPLCEMVEALLKHQVPVHVLRDVTRGGLATVLKELAVASSCTIKLQEDKLPVTSQVRDFCGLLGLDPLYMGNEGKMVVIVPKENAQQTLQLLLSHPYGADAAIIGSVHTPSEKQEQGRLLLETKYGAHRVLDILQGEGLPRIC